jgi:hypothetical protein
VFSGLRHGRRVRPLLLTGLLRRCFPRRRPTTGRPWTGFEGRLQEAAVPEIVDIAPKGQLFFCFGLLEFWSDYYDWLFGIVLTVDVCAYVVQHVVMVCKI